MSPTNTGLFLNVWQSQISDPDFTYAAGQQLPEISILVNQNEEIQQSCEKKFTF
jgi:hypothetical protein